MRLSAVVLSVALSVIAGQAVANAPSRSDRPLPRGVSIEAVVTTVQGATVRPKERRGLARLLGLRKSDRPEQRPKKTQKAVQTRNLSGSVCGDPSIRGVEIPPIRGRGQCGVQRAVRISSVAGVGLSQKPTIDCSTAKALKTWVDRGLKPAVGKTGGGVIAIVPRRGSCPSTRRAGPLI